MCTYASAQACKDLGQRRTSAVLQCRSMPFSGETGSLTEPRIDWHPVYTHTHTQYWNYMTMPCFVHGFWEFELRPSYLTHWAVSPVRNDLFWFPNWWGNNPSWPGRHGKVHSGRSMPLGPPRSSVDHEAEGEINHWNWATALKSCPTVIHFL